MLLWLVGCAMFTDSSAAGGGIHFQLRRTDDSPCATGNTWSGCSQTENWAGRVFFDDDMGSTWSGSGLVHHECGPWHTLSDISCGYSWGDTCQVDMKHEQGVSVNIFGFDFELWHAGDTNTASPTTASPTTASPTGRSRKL